MPTNRKRKSRNFSTPVLLDFVRILLMRGPQARHQAVMDYNARRNDPERVGMTGQAEAFQMCVPATGVHPDQGIFKRYPLTAEAWNIHRAEILRLWKIERRKGAPWGSQFDKE